MKMLFENWRRYLKENKWGDAEKQAYLRTLGLHMVKVEGEYNVYMYEWNKQRQFPKIVGTLGTMEMGSIGSEMPCIPDTQEVGTVAVESGYENRGIGSHMYEVVAYYMKMEQNGGITSDHSASTTNVAANVWKKLQNRLNYVKRKTPKGPEEDTYDEKTGEIVPAYKGENDEFDYDDNTPDPNDDCYEPSGGVPPTDSSLQIPPERVGKVAELMDIQMNNFSKMTSLTHFDVQGVQGDGYNLFNRVYNPGMTGIYQGEEK